MTKVTYRSNQCQPLNSTLKMPDSNLVPPIGSNGDTEPIQGAIACVVFRSRQQIEF